MAMAGLIQEQTKQAVNGLPGVDQLPVLGALFRSQDFVNNQTELMVLVTPYVVRAVAQKELSRPDDGFAPASDSQSALLARINRIYGVAARVETGRRLSGQFRLHHRLRRSCPDRLRDEDRTMTTTTPIDRCRTLAPAGRARRPFGRARGCTLRPTRVVTASVPDDYRQRHPIAIHGSQPLDRRLRRSRTRRPVRPRNAPMSLGLAQIWVARRHRRDRRRRARRHAELTGGGERHSSEIRALLAAGGVPSQRHHLASLSSGRSPNASRRSG